jgi:hypothetical protein
MSLFSARFKPRGTLARGRRDWSVEKLTTQFSAGGGLAGDTWTMFLYNDDTNGRYLALYGLFVQNGAQTIGGFDFLINQDVDRSIGLAPGAMLKFDEPIGPGLWTALLNSSFPFITDLFYPYNGNTFAYLESEPFCLIPPGMSIGVASFNQSKGSTISMIWAPY